MPSLQNNNTGITAIAGGSGLIGFALARSLPRVLVLTRSEKSTYIHQQWGNNGMHWNPYQSPSKQLITASKQFSSIVCLNGISLDAKRWNKNVKHDLIESRLQPLRQAIDLLRYAKQHTTHDGHIASPCLVVASGVGIYPHGFAVCDESSPSGTSFLAEVSNVIENEAQQAVQYGIRVVILRFGVVLSTQGGALAKMLPLFRLGLGGKLGKGTQWFSWITLADIVQIIQQALAQHTMQGVYNATSPHPVTNAEFTRTLARTLQKPALCTVPRFALKLGVGEMADTLLTSNRVIPKRLLDEGFQFTFPTIQEALRAVVESSS